MDGTRLNEHSPYERIISACMNYSNIWKMREKMKQIPAREWEKINRLWRQNKSNVTYVYEGLL